jgi:AcrR family transcriptional regulator
MPPVDKAARRNNTDRRVKRTKNALRAALFTLLKEKSVNEITVTELTDLADVNRATFYFYYNDIIDMVQQIQNEVFDRFTAITDEMPSVLKTEDEMVECLEHILDYIHKNAEACRFVADNDISFHLQDKLSKLLMSHLYDATEHFPKDCAAHYMTNYGLNGAIGIIINWLNDGMKVDVHEMARFTAHIFLVGAHQVHNEYRSKES